MGILFNPVEGNSIIRVDSPYKLKPPLRSDVVYFIDGIIDLTSTGIFLEVPVGGLSLSGYNFNVSQLICSEDDYSLFRSPVGGSGDLILQDISFTTNGVSSELFDITDSDGSHAIEITSVNFLSCTSLGQLTDYRQVLETGTGRLFGTPELTLNGSMNGYRIDTTIAFAMNNITALFKAGTNLSFSGRFVTDINCSLPTNGAFADFSAINFVNDESFLIQGAYIARDGVFDASDISILPNIDETSVKCNWKGNTGIKNTKKYIKSTLTTEVETVINAIDTYYPIEGVGVINTATHFTMTPDSHFELLTGSSSYFVNGDITVEGTANDVIDIRVTKSTDGGVTFPIEVNHIRRVVNNLAGGRDVAFFPLNFIVDMNKGDRLRVEIENKSSTDNVTAELDSYFIVSEA